MELGNIVCAVREYAPLFIRAIKLGMGASGIASGRKPSMDRISTRRARGAGVAVAVIVGDNVNVGRIVAVAVAVDVDDGVDVAGCKSTLPGS